MTTSKSLAQRHLVLVPTETNPLEQLAKALVRTLTLAVERFNALPKETRDAIVHAAAQDTTERARPSI